jgi:hypothetical protein
MPKYHYSVITENKYPIETKGYVECTAWGTAANRAIRNHKKEMKERGPGRRFGNKVIVKLIKMPEEAKETT